MTVTEEVAYLLKQMQVDGNHFVPDMVLGDLVKELHELRKLKNPIPSPVSEEWLSDTRKIILIEETHVPHSGMVELLFEHIDHLEGLLRDARLDWGEESWKDRIYREGRKSLLEFIKKLEYTSYSHCPCCFMVRGSTNSHNLGCELAKLIQELES